MEHCFSLFAEEYGSQRLQPVEDQAFGVLYNISLISQWFEIQI